MCDDRVEKKYSFVPEAPAPVLQPAAFPVALPVAYASNKLVSAISLRLGLLCGGSFLLGYIVLPVIGVILAGSNETVNGLLSLVCPFLSIIILFAGGWLLYGSWRKLFADLNFCQFPMMMFMVWGFPLALGISFASAVITTLWQLAGEKMGLEFGIPPTVEIMQSQEHWQVAAMAVTALLAAPLYEEILFRRVLFGLVYQYCGRWVAYAVTALAFGLVHMSLLQLPGFLLIASLWQFLYVRERNLWVSIILHFYNNLVAVSMLLIIRYKDFLIELLMRLNANT